MNAQEVIFIGLPGPTHNYGGLAAGNIASARNAGNISHPRQALMQALDLAEKLMELGLSVAVLPPQLRPYLPALRAAGFSGTAADVIAGAAEQNPQLLARVYSSAAMWTANAATVSPSWDTTDKTLHVTPANLITNLHRAIEAESTYAVLKQVFAGAHMQCHLPLEAEIAMADEGAANHTRLAPSHAEQGLHVFVYGRGSANAPQPKKFPARQTLAASQQIASQHHLPPAHCLFIQQNPAAIDAGVFHNDVICVGNESVLLVHEQAFAGGLRDILGIADAYRQRFDKTLTSVMVSSDELSMEDAVSTYFFNSQLVTLPSGEMALISPLEVREHAKASALVDRLCADDANPITQVHYLDLRQSMRNGGGPACLRLRVPMTQTEIEAVRDHCKVMLTADMLEELRQWGDIHYREQVAPNDLADAALYEECRLALTDLSRLLRLALIDD